MSTTMRRVRNLGRGETDQQLVDRASATVLNLRAQRPTTTHVLFLTDLEASLVEAACKASPSLAVRDVGALVRAQVLDALERAAGSDSAPARGYLRPVQS